MLEPRKTVRAIAKAGAATSEKILSAEFYSTLAGNEPVLDWLKGLSKEDRKSIGNDIRTVELGWPIGMPVCCELEGYSGLREVLSEISGGCIATEYFLHQWQ